MIDDNINMKKNAFISSVLKEIRSENSFNESIKNILRALSIYADVAFSRIYAIVEKVETVYFYSFEDDCLKISCLENEPPRSGFAAVCAAIADKPYAYFDASGCTDGCEIEFESLGTKACYLFSVKNENKEVGLVALSERENNRVWEQYVKDIAKDFSEIILTFLMDKMCILSHKQKKDALKLIVDNINSYVFVTDIADGVVIFANNAFKNMFGKDVIGKTSGEILGECTKKSNIITLSDEETLACDSKAYDCYCEKIGQWLNVTERVVNWNGGKTVVLHAINDITNVVEYEKLIEREAFIDNLTGINNRRIFEINLNTISKAAEKNNEKGYLVLIDLDNFMNINDSLGYRYGDELLRMAAKKLIELNVPGVSVYRYGGDEFSLIVPPSAAESIDKILNTLHKTFRNEWLIIDAMYYFTVSVGCVSFPDYGVGAGTLMKKADIALYKAKKSGKNRTVMFNTDIETSILRLYEIERRMRSDVADGCKNFEMYYQPIIDAESKKMIGAEALLRWNCETLGLIGPAEFISVAEDIGLINQIGEFVIKTAARQTKAWREIFSGEFKMNINLSVCQLVEADFIPTIKSIFEKENVPFSSIIFEVTESLAINDMDNMKVVLNAIRDLGANIALDDFGTGYSSLNCFKEMPLSTVKIDKSLLDDIETNPITNVFIKSIVDMTHGFDMRVCAEGVETEGQYEILRNGNVDVIQGFFFGKPCRAVDFERQFS